jgi:acetyl esterase/lipase
MKWWLAASVGLFLGLGAAGGSAGAEPQKMVIDVWPGKVPGDVGIKGEEHFQELKPGEKPYAKWLANVTKPTITVYRPSKDKDTGAAALVCPGGGYHRLAWDKEGEEVAVWLNSIGVTGIVLKYRCPRRPGEDKRLPAPGPLKDAQRAVSLVRSKAREWGIDPERIGMVGFSAGGHLAGATATHFDQRAYEAIDDIDKVSSRPNFAVMVYPGYLKAQDKDELAPHMRIPAGTPPIMLVVAEDDECGSAEDCAVMYLALKRARVPVELHAYASGGHGFGVRQIGQPCSTWTRNCAEWLRHQGFLKPRPTERE